MSRSRAVAVQCLMVATAFLAIVDLGLVVQMKSIVATQSLLITSPTGKERATLLGEENGLLVVVQDDRQILAGVSLLSRGGRTLVRVNAPTGGDDADKLAMEIPLHALAEALRDAARDQRRRGEDGRPPSAGQPSGAHRPLAGANAR